MDAQISLNAAVADSSVATALASSWPCGCIATPISHSVNCYVLGSAAIFSCLVPTVHEGPLSI